MDRAVPSFCHQEPKKERYPDTFLPDLFFLQCGGSGGDKFPMDLQIKKTLEYCAPCSARFGREADMKTVSAVAVEMPGKAYNVPA
jgi:hypothetical protein